MRFSGSLPDIRLARRTWCARAMSKKRRPRTSKRERGAFIRGDASRNITGCVANGIPEQTAEAIYNEMYDFANYAFNKAHSVCYAVIAYQTAWFKCYYPREYMAALMTSVLGSSVKISEYISECRAMGIALLPPDINESNDNFPLLCQAESVSAWRRSRISDAALFRRS